MTNRNICSICIMTKYSFDIQLNILHMYSQQAAFTIHDSLRKVTDINEPDTFYGIIIVYDVIKGKLILNLFFGDSLFLRVFRYLVQVLIGKAIIKHYKANSSITTAKIAVLCKTLQK